MSEPFVRPATAADATRLAELRYEFRASVGPPTETQEEFVERASAWMRERLEAGGAWRCWVVEADDMAETGPDWLEPRFYVSFATDTVRIRPRAFRADWNDPRLAQAPERFRGTHYCHLIAPQYVKRIVLGEVNLR